MPDTAIPSQMLAVVTVGAGGYDKLVLKEVPVPTPQEGEVLLRVRAAGVNNTDINTRLGWYAAAVTSGTDDTENGRSDGGWNEATPFPLIQGTDCCGEVVAVGPGVAAPLGARVLVRASMRTNGFGDMATRWLGTDFDGAFAQYVKVPASEIFAVDCDWEDAELAAIPCAYGTAENMLHRAGIAAGMRVLVPGASGGVGTAVVQLARLRGATVIAVTSADKREAVAALGAAEVLTRQDDPLAVLGKESVDVVVDNVAGPGFGTMLAVLQRGGRYVSSGAIAGPVVALDMRQMYLKDITLIGTTAWDEPVFPGLVAAIEADAFRPPVAATYPLAEIADAQRAFQDKRHVGKLVLIPPA